MAHYLSRRRFMQVAGAAALLETLPRFSTAAGAADKPRPNILLCMTDDQGWGEMAYYGHPYLKTPVLDEMAAANLRFDRFYSGAPVCSPTRASVMTGRNPVRMGTLTYGYAIRPEEVTIAQVLKKAGYRTGHFGKWHLGPVKADSPVNPNKCGFDEYLSHDNFFEINPALSRNGAPPEVIKGESSEIVVHEALEFMRKVQAEGKPFLAVVWFASPHSPYKGTENDLALYSKVASKPMQNRFAEITAMDRAMGVLRKSLREMKIADNTLLWFNSDNGIPGDAFKAGWDADLRGAKGSVWEGGIRVPAIIEWPAVIQKPRITTMPCVTSDIFPTVLDLLGLQLPDRPIDGISLKPLLLGESMTQRPRPIGFWVHDLQGEQKNEPWMDPELLVGTDRPFSNFRHPKPLTEGFAGNAAWRDNRFKLVALGKGQAQLYDIDTDPLEKTNIAAANPDVVKKMETQLHEWQKSVERSLSGADYH